MNRWTESKGKREFMMNAIKVLKAEHDLILAFIDSLKSSLKSMEWRMDSGPPSQYFRNAIAFAQGFADQFHHHKEEHIMFTLLAQRCEGRFDAEIERLRQQHEYNRTLLAEALSARGEESSGKKLHFNLMQCAQNLRSHIKLEDEEFFPLVEKSLTPDDAALLEKEFASREDESSGPVLSEYRLQFSKLCNQVSTG